MKNCSYCGVELENNMNFCPLCGESVQDENNIDNEYIRISVKEDPERHLTDFQKLSPFQKRKLIWEISAIILLSGMVVTFIIDIIGDNALTWSKYTLAACFVLFLTVSLITFFYLKIYLVLGGSFISSSILLILFDKFSGSMDWGLSLGIPMLFGAYSVIFILIILIRQSKNKGLNIIAYCLVAGGLISVVTENFISLYSQNKIIFKWSPIVMASVLPVALLLLYLHFRLKKNRDLIRFFHI